MADRRFTVQTEPRGTNTGKPTISNNNARDDAKAPSNVGISSIANSTTGASMQAAERNTSISVFRRLSMSMGNSRKSSMSLMPNQVRPNTYRMEPDNEYRFRPYRIQAKILETVIEQMKNRTYDPTTVNELVKNVSRSVHQLVKNFQLPRYKIIVQTVIGQKCEQLVRVASRCLWDTKTDNMLSVNYETEDMLVVVTVYAVYFE
jgi:tctex1 domain-containing protein 2